MNTQHPEHWRFKAMRDAQKMESRMHGLAQRLQWTRGAVHDLRVENQYLRAANNEMLHGLKRLVDMEEKIATMAERIADAVYVP